MSRSIFGVLDSQGSAETLVRRGGITNYHLIAYSFSNISAKNYQNKLMCIEVIALNVIVVFLKHSVYITVYVLRRNDRLRVTEICHFILNFLFIWLKLS